MRIAVVIFAKDEERRIGTMLHDLARQDALADLDTQIEIIVVANGCSDHTADVAADFKGSFERKLNVKFAVEEIPRPGKARAWNHVVHNVIKPSNDLVIFMDADIRLASDSILSEIIEPLRIDHNLIAVSGFPIKDAVLKEKSSLIERFSLQASEETRYSDCINGSLYAVRLCEVEKIWLPSQTPGEDGFINAMLTTKGFVEEPDHTLVRQLAKPTHFYETVRPLEFVRHEQRMIVGTVVNATIFDYLWALSLKNHAGELIQKLNISNENWVDDLLAIRFSKLGWHIPNNLTFRRLRADKSRTGFKRLKSYMLRLTVTLMTVPSVILANRTLSKKGASTFW